MSANSHCVGGRILLASVAIVCTVFGLSNTAWAQRRFGSDDDRATLTCGRARSLAWLPYSKPFDIPDSADRETLSDTDLLHYVLDLEVSDLDPAGNTCVLTGTNVMTIQSKVSSLTEFTFRLREQYVITGAYVNGATAVVVTDVPETTRIVTLDRAYSLDEIFTLTIEYTGDSYEILGVYSSIRVDTQPDDTPIVATL